MDFFDSEEEAAFRADLRAWLDGNVEVERHDVGRAQEGIEEWRAWSRKLYEAGYVGLTWPKEGGGAGLTPNFEAIYLEEMARSGARSHLGVIGVGMAGPTILSWGTDEQKRRYAPRILDASEIWCQGFSEPGAGSDLAGVSTRAVLDGDHWVVNGQKVWSSWAHIADFCILLVRTDPDAPRHKGMSYLLLDMKSPGVEVRPLVQITGDPEFNEIFLTDVRVPKDSMLGQPGDGWNVAMTTLGHERGTFTISLAATMEVQLREVVELARRPRPDGSRPIEDVGLRRELAQFWVEIQTIRAAAVRTLSQLMATGDPGPGAPGIKLAWSELAQRLSHLGAELEGPTGVDPTERWTYLRLRARGNTIEMGTSEIVRGLLAERALGLPRSR